jgi:hypothetical protein
VRLLAELLAYPHLQREALEQVRPCLGQLVAEWACRHRRELLAECLLADRHPLAVVLVVLLENLDPCLFLVMLMLTFVVKHFVGGYAICCRAKSGLR